MSDSELHRLLLRLGGVEPAVGDTFYPLSPDEVNEIEDSIEHRFDETFRKLLRAYGSVIFTESVFYRSNRGIVSLILGAIHPGVPHAKNLAIEFVFRLLSNELKDGVVPFADNGVGDYLCFDLSEEGSGSVYLWDHEAPADVDDLHSVSDSFDTWLRSLEI